MKNVGRSIGNGKRIVSFDYLWKLAKEWATKNGYKVTCSGAEGFAAY